jgi:hypothetical protein
MEKTNKIAIIGFGLGFLLFFGMEKLIFSKKGLAVASSKKKPSDAELQIAASAYEEALLNNESQSVLNDMNNEFEEEYGIQVHQKVSDGTILITDLAGNQVATYQPQSK